MTVLLAIVLVAALGTWIPLAQLLPGTPERTRILYVAVDNAVFAGIALLASGADLVFGWRGFWLPLAGGVVWTAGNYCVFKASETHQGLDRGGQCGHGEAPARRRSGDDAPECGTSAGGSIYR
jgi:hypothetical protein